MNDADEAQWMGMANKRECGGRGEDEGCVERRVGTEGRGKEGARGMECGGGGEKQRAGNERRWGKLGGGGREGETK